MKLQCQKNAILATSIFFKGDEWVSGKNAYPLLMSLRSGTRVRTYKPVVYKPADPLSDKNNDRKFMFLSEETRPPDYRPKESQEDKAVPCIDHRPMGAESYGKHGVGFEKIRNTRRGNSVMKMDKRQDKRDQTSFL